MERPRPPLWATTAIPLPFFTTLRRSAIGLVAGDEAFPKARRRGGKRVVERRKKE
uniref:Uncharacterized protein n=1 Tax=Oryza sativa subsp. japonica TaxID=39947 RepID=Q6ZDY6_ORYSJ|nr:hypothetical protein [Oryza sativa Japonica Group]